MSRPGVLIVGSAPVASREPWYVDLIRSFPTVIAADGGLSLCLKADRTPVLLVGDLDSANPLDVERAISLGTAVKRFPAGKDASDLDLAVSEARQSGAESLVITACFAGRIDHTIAAFGSLLGAADLHAKGMEPDATLYALDAASVGMLELDEPPGATISVFAVDSGAVIDIEGVRYPLAATFMHPLSSLGLSNVPEAPSQRVRVERGRVLVVVSYQGDNDPHRPSRA